MKQAKLLNANERKRLTAIINNKRYQTRNHTIVALSFYAGLRACEIAALKVSDVFDGSGEVRDTIQLASSQTKGNDAGIVLVSKRLAEQLKKFGKQYKSHVKRTDAPLIFSAKGGGFNAQTIINLFQKLYEEAGITGVRVKADCPLAAMFGYIGDLRTMTSGRGQFSMEFSHYAPCPNNVAESVIAEVKARKAAS